jgi:hypothetical protein
MNYHTLLLSFRRVDLLREGIGSTLASSSRQLYCVLQAKGSCWLQHTSFGTSKLLIDDAMKLSTFLQDCVGVLPRTSSDDDGVGGKSVWKARSRSYPISPHDPTHDLSYRYVFYAILYGHKILVQTPRAVAFLVVRNFGLPSPYNISGIFFIARKRNMRVNRQTRQPPSITHTATRRDKEHVFPWRRSGLEARTTPCPARKKLQPRW